MKFEQYFGVEQFAAGFCRLLNKNDLFFSPYWERAFSEDCRVQMFSLPIVIEKIEARIDAGNHFIWEDGHPVSMATHTRSTQNGAGVNCVYTPPNYRGKGYASSLVAELSRTLLERGNKFCFLFADADNPISCGIYRKIGYYDLCVFDEVRFDM